MKAVTADWMKSARNDLETIEVILGNANLTAVESKHFIDLDEDTLSLLNKLYIDSRYPGAFGLLPTGGPTQEDAQEFARFARKAMEISENIFWNR